MHPILIDIGPVTLYSYGFFIAAAILLGLGLSMKEARRKNLNHKLIPDLGFYLILGALAGSRLLYVLLNPLYFLENPLQIIQFWKGGLVFVGGAIAAGLIAWLYLNKKKEPFRKWLDAFAPGIAAGQALGRIGCIMAGCCYGKQCSLPWSVTFKNPNSLAPLNSPLHPTQLYHSLSGLIIFILLIAAKKKVRQPGQLFALFLMLYALFRFVVEFFRGDFRGHLGFLSVTQWIVCLVFVLGVSLFYTFRRN